MKTITIKTLAIGIVATTMLVFTSCKKNRTYYVQLLQALKLILPLTHIQMLTHLLKCLKQLPKNIVNLVHLQLLSHIMVLDLQILQVPKFGTCIKFITILLMLLIQIQMLKLVL